MANIKSQIKRNRQNEKRRARNVKVKSALRTSAKKVVKAVDAKESPEQLMGKYKDFAKTIDKAAGVRVVHKNTAARKKSRLAKRINAVIKSQSQGS
ncbi:MAG: 30S ribosomal protein S20 [Spirochaetes bacterium]|nr:30S ribosomal protein S20 [Spirochaetota bacterium]